MEQDNGFIGDIKYSILEPGKFETYHPGWKLLKGQAIELDSGLGKEGITHLPDARGVFLRGMNENQNVENGDSDGNRSIGSYQNDEFKVHNHNLDIIIGHGLWSFGDNVPGQGWACQWNNAPETRLAHNEGGKETRPRNITLYIYIKID